VQDKPVYTTGEAAKVCRLSQQTIIRCFDNGQLDGFRVPGSRFRRIPRANLMRFMRENDIPMDGFGNGRVRVLVVDDEPDIVELFVDALEADGRFEVSTAQTGYEAGMLTEKVRPEIVILDYLLPDINGTAVCKTIRSQPELSGVKILAISAIANPAEEAGMLEAGADAFIKKPFNIEHVIERIMELVRG
jgi:excisionase family DNA binding protein